MSLISTKYFTSIVFPEKELSKRLKKIIEQLSNFPGGARIALDQSLEGGYEVAIDPASYSDLDSVTDLSSEGLMIRTWFDTANGRNHIGFGGDRNCVRVIVKAEKIESIKHFFDILATDLELQITDNPSELLIQEALKTEVETKFTDSNILLKIKLEALHPKVIERCKALFEDKHFDSAILTAGKVIETTIRARINGAPEDLGTALIDKAMSPNNPLLEFSKIKSEQQAVHSLYRGTIGWLKNPQSHRFIDVNNEEEAFEALAFVSYLMRILEKAIFIGNT